MTDFNPIVYQGKRVLLTSQLAEGYETNTDTIKRNYHNNKKRYIEGKHYFLLEGDELRGFKREVKNLDLAPSTNKLYLWTERGAFLHAKSLGGDRAWELYEEMIETYFRAAEIVRNNAPPHLAPETSPAALERLIKITRRVLLDAGGTAADVLKTTISIYQTWNIPVPEALTMPLKRQVSFEEMGLLEG